MSQETHLSPQQQAKIDGKALQLLREESRTPEGGRWTQEAAAAAYGVKRQAWHNYEQGDRLVILQPQVQERLAVALGRTRDDFLAARAKVLGEEPPQREGRSFGAPNVYELPVLGRVRAGPDGPQVYDVGGEPESTFDVSWLFGPTARTLRVAGESMTGYVESGQLVIYDTKIWPSRGEGCVVELHTGDLFVKEYAGTAQGVLTVRQRFPEETLTFPMAAVKGVYQVRLRGS